MNLQHERMLSLCETLNLPFIAQGYAVASQEAAEKEAAYSDFLEGLLRTEAAGRQVRKQSMLTRLAGFPANLEEAAMDLGTSYWGAQWRVILPMIMPALLAAFLTAFKSPIETPDPPNSLASLFNIWIHLPPTCAPWVSNTPSAKNSMRRRPRSWLR